MGKKLTKERIQAKLYRLEELKKYQSYYGLNTPYPVIVEINDLEFELQRLLQTSMTHSVTAAEKKVVKKKKKAPVPFWQFWRMSGPTFDAIATIAFFGLIFLFGSVIFAAYAYTRHKHPDPVAAYYSPLDPIIPTLRPTFTSTPDVGKMLLTAPGGTIDGSTFLPPPGKAATEVPTPVPTLTPSATPPPTTIPTPTTTPLPTNPPPPAPPASRPIAQPAVHSNAEPAAVVPTPEQPAAPPASSYPFSLGEQGNREFQRTNYHAITVYVAAVSAGNIPIGGLKVVGDHVPSGMHAESALSDWYWSVVNCLDCDYVKQGNLKFELGTFTDGVWNIYLADPGGAPVSPVVSLPYSTDPSQWVWDFIVFRRNS